MRKISEYSFSSILKLRPLVDLLREKRNDIMLHYYLKKTKPAEEFLEKNKFLHGQNIIGVIAFEQPVAIRWLLQLARKNISEFKLVVFDNSNCHRMAGEIEIICKELNFPYVRLPENRTHHVNRSHGLALTWAYTNVIGKISPDFFGFIDHDLLPIKDVKILSTLKKQKIYGLINKGMFDYWSLWAGYCFFEFSALKNKEVNFLYDFPRGLDTGGRNWDCLYARVKEEMLEKVSNDSPCFSINGLSRKVQVIDGSWYHIGSIGYNNNFDGKKEFFEALLQPYLD